MRAAVLTRPQQIELQNIKVPDYKDDQLRIRVEGCGICASSIPVWEGRDWFTYPLPPGSPGHEGWGTVEAVGKEAKDFKINDRVAFLSNNAFAEYDVVNVGSVVKLPAALNGKPFPAEPLGCAMNIFERSAIESGQTVAIIGIGFLGALLCQLAKHRGVRVIAISRRKYSLELAKIYGADELIELTSVWEVANKVGEITGGEMCPRVIEATGKQEALDVGTEIVAERGTLVVAGYHQDGLRQVNFQKWNWKGIDVINAHERDERKYIEGMRRAVDAVANGILQPEMLYTDILDLEHVASGFEQTRNRPDGFMKALVII